MAFADGLMPVVLLDEDPELGAALEGDDLEQARRLIIVPATTIGLGPWHPASILEEPSLGLLVLDGLLTVNVTIGDRVASDIAGPGDVLHVADAPGDLLLPADIGYFVNEPTRVAVLDRRFIASVRRWPALLLALHERLRLQERRHAVNAAIAKLPRVEDRVLALLWHLVERWGRVTSAGVVVPLALTQETIGRLVGAARPTVSLGLTELARTGSVSRRDDGAFVLDPDARLRLGWERSKSGRAEPLTVVRTADAGSLADAGTPSRPPLVDIVSVRRRIAALHDELPERTRDVEERLARSQAGKDRNSRLRARVAAERDERRGGRR